MKNHEEFRSTVFEKARKYEVRRKARNKKIWETASLCSLALVIALVSYLGIFPGFLMPELSDESTTDITSDTPLVATTQTSETATESSSMTTEQTTLEMSAVETTTMLEQTMTDTTCESTTEEPISSYRVDFRATAKTNDFAIGETEIIELTNFAMWQEFLEKYSDDYPALATGGMAKDDFDEAYFEENVLVVVQYAGYDLVAFGFNTMDFGSESFTLHVSLRENPLHDKKQIDILSVCKDAYEGTEIIIWKDRTN